MDAPVSCDEPGAIHPLLGEWGRGSGEFFIDGDCRIGIAIVPGLTCPGKTNIPADVMISNVSICGCRLDLELSPQAERVDIGKLIKLRGE
jgi:hypothetical protein